VPPYAALLTLALRTNENSNGRLIVETSVSQKYSISTTDETYCDRATIVHVRREIRQIASLRGAYRRSCWLYFFSTDGRGIVSGSSAKKLRLRRRRLVSAAGTTKCASSQGTENDRIFDVMAVLHIDAAVFPRLVPRLVLSPVASAAGFWLL
jgi:hypothetical protein